MLLALVRDSTVGLALPTYLVLPFFPPVFTLFLLAADVADALGTNPYDDNSEHNKDSDQHI